ncbi:hypothetical protein Tco_0434327 [Tanacetum coccineum]
MWRQWKNMVYIVMIFLYENDALMSILDEMQNRVYKVGMDKSKNHKKTVKIEQTRTRESEEYKAEARKVKPQSNIGLRLCVYWCFDSVGGSMVGFEWFDVDVNFVCRVVGGVLVLGIGGCGGKERFFGMGVFVWFGVEGVDVFNVMVFVGVLVVAVLVRDVMGEGVLCGLVLLYVLEGDLWVGVVVVNVVIQSMVSGEGECVRWGFCGVGVYVFGLGGWSVGGGFEVGVGGG